MQVSAIHFGASAWACRPGPVVPRAAVTGVAAVEAIPVAPIEPTKPELLKPLPFWQHLERENLRRPLGVLGKGGLIDVMA
jgi:hypothetical protein